MMPIRVQYGPVKGLGQLAVNAGEGEDFWRRFQAEQGMVQSQRQYNLANAEIAQRAFALQQAYANRPTSAPAGGAQVAQGPAQPAQLQMQQALDSINQAFKRGTISQEDRDRMVIAARTGNTSLGSIGVDEDRGRQTGMSFSQQRLHRNDVLRAEVERLEALEENAKGRASRFLESIPGGVTGMTGDEQKQYKQLAQAVEQVRTQKADAYREYQTGAVPQAFGGSGDGGVPVNPNVPGANMQPVGPIIRNPQTGEEMMLKNGRWVPAP
jgi:hypothetical protein